MTDRVVITGAAGRIGTLLRAHLEEQGIDLLLIDRNPADDPSIVAADLSEFHPDWVARLTATDVLVHLAAEPRLDAPWPLLQRDNLETTLNVLEAARQRGVRRVVLASSVQAAIGRIGRESIIDTRGAGAPVNLYGATKCIAECLGAHYTLHFGLSVVALRLGWVQAGANRPGPHMGPVCDQQIWLSNRDLCAGLVSAIRAPETLHFGVFNLLSDNTDMPWDIGETLRTLNWSPEDHFLPQAPPDSGTQGPYWRMQVRQCIWRLFRRPLAWMCKRVRADHET